MDAEKHEPSWIWTGVDHSANAWVAFRRGFRVSTPRTVRLKIACADKYWLWINGVPSVREGGLKSGPTRGDWYVDEPDIGGLVTTGVNQLAVLVWHWGRDGASHRNSGQGGLLVELECDGRRLMSDRRWRAKRHPAFGQHGGGVSVTLAEQAVDFDARADMPGWMEPAFDDGGWDHAVELGVPPAAPWGRLFPRPIPQWRDSDIQAYENRVELGLPVTGPATVIGRLPKNLQVYPFMRLRAQAGVEIGVQIERDKKRTRYVCRDGEQSFEVPAWGNGHEVAYDVPAGVELVDIGYRETGYDTGVCGAFASSDAALDGLWAKAAHTARLCMRDTFMDCPDRERSPWIGDAANILEVTLRALDRRSDALIVKTLDELAGWAATEGNLWSAVPTSRFAGAFREFPAQVLMMLGFGLPAYLRHTGDLAAAERFYPAMRRYLLELHHVERGVVVHRGPWTVGWGAGVQCWYDWGENVDAAALDQLLYFEALGGLERCAVLLGIGADAELCRRVRDAMRAAFEAGFWSDAIRGYRSPRHDGSPDERVQALAIVTGMAPASRHADLADCIEKTERCSIYMERFPLEALALAGRPQSALRRLKRRFAAEIGSPYSTLPEAFGEESNHAWGGAAIVVLAGRLSGIEVLGPGYLRVRFAPQDGGLEWARHVIPTLHGELRLEYRCEVGWARYDLAIPPGVTVELEMLRKPGRVTVNGGFFDPAGATSVPLCSGDWRVEWHGGCRG